MRKSLSILLAGFLLIFNSLPVFAANNLPIAKSNSYTVSATGGGTYEYTVPFTGNYEITLAGAQGASYSSNSGGLAYTVSSTIRLNKGDVIKFVLNNRPSYSSSGGVLMVPAGVKSDMYVNNTLKITAGGGAGNVDNNIAPSGITSVRVYNGNGSYTTLGTHWHTGNGKSGATHNNTFQQLDTRNNPGGCYTHHWHTHDSQCDYKSWHTHENCVYHNVKDEYGNDDSDKSWTEHHCTPRSKHEGDTRDNHYTIGCGYQQGQILGINNGSYTPGSCSGAVGSSVLNHSGNGSFSIRLAEQDTLFYHDGLVSRTNLTYLNTVVDLVIKDDVVVYYKRR